MKAIIRNKHNGVTTEVYSTTEHPASSYGLAIWVDEDNNPYYQIDLPSVFYEELELSGIEHLGQYLRGQRMSRRESLRDVAAALGIAPNTIRNIEADAGSAKIETISELCRYYGKNIKI